MTTETKHYVTGVPKSGERHRRVLAGELCLVHNHVRPKDFTPDWPLGMNGFRAWVQEPSEKLEVCECEWAPSLPRHYRIKRAIIEEGRQRQARGVRGAVGLIM